MTDSAALLTECNKIMGKKIIDGILLYNAGYEAGIAKSDQLCADLLTETQRLRNELINIRRLEYVIPNASADLLILRAVAMARKALEPTREE